MLEALRAPVRLLFAGPRASWTVGLVLAALVLTALPSEDRIADRMWLGLPLLAAGCAAANGGALEFAGRYALMEIGLHASKRGLGDRPINRRPNGGLEGFPSGHTAATSFGASSLVHECLGLAPPLRIAAVVAAGFTGASRVSTGAHTVWQVLAGAVWALLFERAFRGPRARARLRRMFTGTDARR